MSKWFRWYEGTTEDGKFRAVARNAKVTVATVTGVWAAILEDAAHPEHRGIATRGEDFWCAVLDVDDAVMQDILEAMNDANLISVGPGAITITKWKERQFETDTTDPTNAERQSRWRAKHKANGNQTPRNGSVTVEKRPDTDTDTDTDTDKKVSGTVGKPTRPTDEEFEIFKRAYPKRKGGNPWPPARKSLSSALAEGAEFAVIISALRAGAGFDRDKIGTEFIPQAVKWVRDRRWEDYAAGLPTLVPMTGIYVAFDSPDMERLIAYERKTKKSFFRDKKGGAYLADGWPPDSTPAEIPLRDAGEPQGAFLSRA